MRALIKSWSISLAAKVSAAVNLAVEEEEEEDLAWSEAWPRLVLALAWAAVFFTGLRLRLDMEGRRRYLNVEDPETAPRKAIDHHTAIVNYQRLQTIALLLGQFS